MTTVCAAVLAAAAAHAAQPAAWDNLDQSRHLAGRMTSPGYMRGKVVLIDRRDYGVRSCVDAARRMEDTWRAFKSKQFVLLGSHSGEAGAEKIARIAKGLSLTYPIYAQAWLASGDGGGAPSVADGTVCVVDCTGKVLYMGKDDRQAVGVVANALMAMGSPQTAKQWRHYIDFEIDVLPGRALNRITDFRKAFPSDAKDYDLAWKQLSSNEDIRRVAKLETLTRQAKDYDFKDKAARRLDPKKVKLAADAFADLKESKNEAVVQEAKNCIADLTWALAELEGGKGLKKR